MAQVRFTVEKRARLLGLVEAGVSIERASESVGVTQKTVNRWVHRGRAGGDEAAVRFAEDLDRARGESDEPLTTADLVRLLERAARKGSVRAITLLLDRLELYEKLGPDGIDDLRSRRRERRGAFDQLDEFDQLDAATSTTERSPNGHRG